MLGQKQHIVQESVPGKQVTLCHLIAHPDAGLSNKLGLCSENAIGIMTITPYEASIIAADCAIKTAAIELVVVDRFTGSLVITGGVSNLEAALTQANLFLAKVLGFETVQLTRS
ncbi:Propanediol utilization protein PduU [Pelotomaculum schinkii]|uniref:Propanediol utilization protein PduU n=1 Tax=Pelotomaculum schinkii TaxID=78350 RepID=A0A4Y7R905_9FIRM|nr:BMC domain-containing protein [Pelotomaculum schinkii]TEB05424.1 Propanediol utilization protein PduU [Pelotomaculum schinkii]